MRKDAACLAALCAALWFAPPAHAGSYDVVSCLAPGAGAINRSWSVETYDVAGRASPSIAGFEPPATPENCGTTGIGLRSSVSASRTVTSGQGAAFVFHAPDGSLVRTMKIWRFGQARASSSAAATPTWVIAARSGAAAGGPTVLGGTSGADYCPSATHPAPAWPGYCAIGAGTFATGGYGEYDDVLTPT